MPEGKSDMERVGLFSEMEYHTIGDRYAGRDPASVPFNQAAYKKRQMIPGGSKLKVEGLQAGYFEPTFKRIMEKEAYNDPVKTRRQQQILSQKKNLGKAFLPSDGDKQAAGLGNYYGTLIGPGNMTSFSPATRPKSKQGEKKKNFYTNPGQKGTGYGYNNVTIGKYGEHSVEPYDRARAIRKKEAEISKNKVRGSSFKSISAPQPTFDKNPYGTDKTFPAKQKAKTPPPVKPFKYASPGPAPGGCKAGTFHAYPNHSVDAYKPRAKKGTTVNSSGKTFQQPNWPKSRPTKSVMNQQIVRTMNANNYKTFSSVSTY